MTQPYLNKAELRRLGLSLETIEALGQAVSISNNISTVTSTSVSGGDTGILEESASQFVGSDVSMDDSYLPRNEIHTENYFLPRNEIPEDDEPQRYAFLLS